MFALAIGLIVGIVVPIINGGKTTGNNSYQRGKNLGTQFSDVLTKWKLREKCHMKKVILGLIMFALAIALTVGVVVPLFNGGRTTGTAAKTNQTGSDTSIGVLANPIP